MSYRPIEPYRRPRRTYGWRDAFYDVVALGTAAGVIVTALIYGWTVFR